MEVLKTKQLKIGYKSNKTIKIIASDINVSLQAGKLISLIGSNGIGKSTFLKTIAGIIPTLDGSVFLNQRQIESFSTTELAENLSLVLTEKLPLSSLSVYELIALGRQPYTNWLGKLSKEDENQIEKALELTQISDLRNRKYYELSDGQFQKVMIARAIAQDTPFIILDEPSTHLDLFHKVSLFKLLQKLAHETNKCVLFSTHDLDLAIQLSDEIIIMKENLFKHNSPAELINQGIFDDFFNDDTIVFDRNTKQFILR
ncbi:ABC transporter ATP-binding protein [Flavobacterium sp. I3-2]|uniref:ABC transporter ATP-binding protein n=1 Tax=Flavobacterium sp. I3-2 TaxID=2748319 RepID=UPI0015AFE4C2|nr:ABC transporter ATP-binding protein [Flavobacterium sp. I3-2]